MIIQSRLDLNTKVLSPEIIGKVRREVKEGEFPFRPTLSEVKVQQSQEVKGVIAKGWAQNPLARPTAQAMQSELQKINPNKYGVRKRCQSALFCCV
jgi:hypothetical protein